MGKPRITRKYPTYPEIPGNKKDTRIYLIVYFDTPTRPEPDPLPCILSNTRSDPILKNPTRWALIFDLLNLVVLGEVEGKCDDVLHGVPRRKEEFSNVDCRSHPS